jgi:hypothetical protein
MSDINNDAIKPAATVLKGLSVVVPALGTAATVFDALGKIFDLLGLFTTSADQITILQNEITQLQIDLTNEDTIWRLTNYQDIMADCEDALQTLLHLHQGSPPTPDVANAAIDNCKRSLDRMVAIDANGLAKPLTYVNQPHWFCVRDVRQQMYFSAYQDASGVKKFEATFSYCRVGDRYWPRSLGRMNFDSMLVPYLTTDGGACVFCPVLILPAYLRALSIFLAVGAVMDLTFTTDCASDLRRHAHFLADIYTKILTEGYVFLPMPGDPSHYDFMSSDQQKVINLWKIGCAYHPDFWTSTLGYDDEIASHLSGFDEPFGCVDRFTGDSIVNNFPLVTESRVPSADTSDKPQRLTQFYRGLLLAALRSGKALYQKQSLEDVRTAANNLYKILGEAPLLPGLSFGDWSMREIYQVIHSFRAAIAQVDHPEHLADANEPSGLRDLLSQLLKSCFTNTPNANDPQSRSLRYLISSQ